VECLEKYAVLLKQNKLKVTPQRLIVLKYLTEHFNHPTAEKIYLDLKSKNPSLSKTTVYNSLEALEKHRIIQAITISGSELRYDFIMDMHHHFMCKRCGKVFNIDFECPNKEIFSSYGHKIEEIHGYIKGVCKYCLKRGE
jgi:Fe2+ or Zn2+ uptake regulation protein